MKQNALTAQRVVSHDSKGSIGGKNEFANWDLTQAGILATAKRQLVVVLNFYKSHFHLCNYPENKVNNI